MTSKATRKTAKKTTRATTAATKAKGTPKATPKAKTPKAATRAKPAAQGGSKPKAKAAAKRKGILDIAAEMLAKSKKPMGCKQIVEQAIGLDNVNGCGNPQNDTDRPALGRSCVDEVVVEQYTSRRRLLLQTQRPRVSSSAVTEQAWPNPRSLG